MNLIGDVNIFICGFRYYYIVYFFEQLVGIIDRENKLYYFW